MPAIQRTRFAARRPPEPDATFLVPAWDGTPLYCETYGDPSLPPLVMSDGIACNGTFFVHLIPYLSRRFRIVRWAYRGHGLSAAPTAYERLTMEDNLRDLRSVMDHVGIATAVHLGYSLGVPVVLDLATREPERVRAMVLMCGAPGRVLDQFHGTSLLRTFLPVGYSLVLGGKPAVSRLMRDVLPTRLAYLAASLVEFDARLLPYDDLAPYLEHVAALDLELFLTMLASAAEQDLRDRLDAVSCPALVVGAARDRFTPSFLSEELYQRIPGSELIIVPGATHALPIEQADLVNLRVEKFLLGLKVDG